LDSNLRKLRKSRRSNTTRKGKKIINSMMKIGKKSRSYVINKNNYCQKAKNISNIRKEGRKINDKVGSGEKWL